MPVPRLWPQGRAPAPPTLCQLLLPEAERGTLAKPACVPAFPALGPNTPRGLTADGAANIAQLPPEFCRIGRGTSRWEVVWWEIFGLEISFSMVPVPRV